MNPKIICICGSTRFVDVMAVKAWEFEKQGIITLCPHLLPEWYEGIKEHHQAEEEGVAHILDELHLRKIDMADEVFVVNLNGYIGQRTSIEISYAEERSKPITFLEPRVKSNILPLAPNAVGGSIPEQAISCADSEGNGKCGAYMKKSLRGTGRSECEVLTVSLGDMPH